MPQDGRFDQTCDALLARGAQDTDADETTFNEITFDGKLLVRDLD